MGINKMNNKIITLITIILSIISITNLRHNATLSKRKGNYYTRARNELFQIKRRGRGYTISYNNRYLSHAFNRVWLQNGYRGEGELWFISYRQGGVAFRA